MVIPQLAGRMGNYMFQVANAYAYSKRFNKDYGVPKCQYSNYFPKINTVNISGLRGSTYTEPSFAYIPVPNIVTENIFLEGYYQSEKYFLDYKKEVADLFDSTIPFSIANYKGGEGWISIHERLTDYKTYSDRFTLAPQSYYKQAIDFFADKGYKNFIVFSDDIKESKTKFTSDIYEGMTFEYSEGNGELQDMFLMKQCEHNISSCSTFAWWGNWLNKNPNKISIYYNRWFPHNELDYKDIFPLNAIIL